ncbi:hypothetical protein Adt_21274 [Abeliophyllum distichum]|uniref:Uncharacterized protein n=1 Tax=Abeliophyllum distichum TaxID=126358 RepID=A0ABD1SZ81_9LAMI
MAGCYFSKISVFKIRGEKVVDEKETILPRLSIPSTTSIVVSTILSIVEVAGNILSSLPTLSAASVLATVVLLMVGTIGGDSSSLLPEASIKSSKIFNIKIKEKGLP